MNSPMTNTGSAADQVLVFPPDRGIGVLAVDPPYPLGFKPQNDGALGININMVYGDRSGLLVYILAYINMSVGDHIRVFIETSNVPVAEFAVTEAHFDAQGQAKNIPFNISPRDMEARFEPLKNQNKDFWFEVQRVSGNTEESPRVPLFYKHPAPGEADTDGGKPFNQGLKLPLASESFVDQSVINDGMFVTVFAYFNQSVGDVVLLAFGSLTLEAEVTALGDVVFELSSERLATLAPTNNLMVRYEIFDRVENASGWSDALVLPFKPGVVLLAAPIFEQADPNDIIHHEALNGSTATVIVTGNFTANDLIELILQGNTKGGEAVTHTFRETLQAADRTVDFAIDNEWVRNLIGGSLRATYTLTRAGKTQLSKPADVTVAGTSHPLGLPLVEPLVDGKLPVDTAEATVRMAAYWPLKKGAKVELRWQTTDKDDIGVLFIFQLIVVDPSQPVVFKVPTQYIAPYANTPLTLQNTITNPDEVEVSSELLQLMIGDVVKIELQPPTLVRPAISPIDVLAYPQGVTVRIEYLGALEGDRARLIEVNAPAGALRFPLVAFNSNKRVITVLSPLFLAARHGKAVEFRWSLNRNNTQVARSPALTLNISKIAPQDTRLPAPIINRADSAGVIDLNGFNDNPLMIFTSWPFSGGGYTVDVNVIGTGTGGGAHTMVVLRRESLNTEEESKGFSRPLARSQMMMFRDNSTLRIETTVYFNDSPQNMMRFPDSRLYVIRNAPPILSESFDNYSTNVISQGGRIVLPSMTISFPGGNGYLGITPLSSISSAHGGPFHAISGQSAGQILEMHVNATGTSQAMRIDFNWGYSYVNCFCRFAQHNDISVYFFNKTNQTLQHRYLANVPYPQQVSCSSSENNIWSMQVVTPRVDLIAFDFFTMHRT